MNVLEEYAQLMLKVSECEARRAEVEKQITELLEYKELLKDKIDTYVLEAKTDVEELGPQLLKQAKKAGLPSFSLDDFFAPIPSTAKAVVDAYIKFYEINRDVHKFAVAWAICEYAAQPRKEFLSAVGRKITDTVHIVESENWPTRTVKYMHQQKRRFDEFAALLNKHESNCELGKIFVDESVRIANERDKLKSCMSKLEPKVQEYETSLRKYSDKTIFSRANAGAQALAEMLEENRAKKLAEVDNALENLETIYDNLLVPASSEGRLRRAYGILQSFMQQRCGEYKDICSAKTGLLASCKVNGPEREVSEFKNAVEKLGYVLGKSGAPEMLATIKRMDELTIYCLEEKMRLGPQIIKLREKQKVLSGVSFYRT